LRNYRTLREARASVKAFVLEVYKRKRPHSALGYLAPEDFVYCLLKKMETLIKLAA
jgi:putative transposase